MGTTARHLLPALCLAAACGSTPTAEPAPVRATPAARLAEDAVAALASRGEPSLESIFSIPGPQGVAPRAVSLSADGRWLLFSWSPMVTAEEGQRSVERAVLRVSDLDGPAGTDRPLSELLPAREDQDDDSAARLSSEWSPAGALLAVARSGQLYLLDFDAGPTPSVRSLHIDPPEEDEAQEGEQQPPAADDAPRERATRLGTPRRMRFRPDAARLAVWTERELFEFDLASETQGLSAARWISEPLEDGTRGVQWSDDFAVAFRPGAELGADGKSQVLRLDTLEALVLEGFAELPSREGERLSPDGRYVLAFSVDRTGQPERNLVPDYLSERVRTLNTRRERADDLSAPRRGWVWDTTSGARVELPLADTPHARVRSLGWAPQPDLSRPARLAISRTSRDFRRRELAVWSAHGWRLLLTESDPRWVGGPAGGPRWSRDGRVLLLPSERLSGSTSPGRCQLFAVSPDDGSRRQLSAVPGEIDDVSLGAEGGVAFTASHGDPARRRLHWLPGPVVRGERDEPAREIESEPGYLAGPLVAARGRALVVSASRVGRPAELFAARSGALTRVTHTVPEPFEALEWILPTRFEVVASDGARLAAQVYLPPGTDLDRPDRARACVVFVHGAGYLQNVTDSMTSYEVNLMFHSRLARMGYVVLDVDYRGSKGYGNRFRTDVQFHLGGRDLDDIHDCVDALAERGLIDPERVGLYGGSYGGFLTLMALFTAPQRWVCGAALRSVTDWRSYQPTYTQPRLGRPSTHAAAYARSSPIDLVEGLEGALLILHGMLDRNVFAQDSIRLMEELIDRGQPFEAMLYPSQGHGFSDGPHWIDEYGRIERFLIAHLGAP